MSFFSSHLGVLLDRGLVVNPEAAPPPVAQGYALTVLNLAGGGPLLHWRRIDGASLNDVVGSRPATIVGTVVEVAGLPQNSDGAIDFGGIGEAIRAHDAGLLLSAFSLSFWATMNSPTSDTAFYPLIRKRISPVATGDMVTYIDDTPNIIARFRDAAGVNQEVASLGLIEVGVPYHICVRADSTGFDFFLNGQLQGKSTGYLGAWSVNSREIAMATDPFFTVDGDVTLDEIALYPRVITTANVLTLAQNTDLPVAVGDSFLVPESVTTAMDVVANDTFVGAKIDLIVTIVDKTSVLAAGHDVTVNASKNINCVASAVTANEVMSFTYKIQDVNGESNTVTVNLTVENAGAPPPTGNQANCFVESGANTVTVSTMADLSSAVQAAPAGRQILIVAGTYNLANFGTMTLNRDGTQAAPIVIRPQNGLGTVTLTGGTLQFAPTSSWLTVSKIHFSGTHIDFWGDHNRISRCQFRDLAHTTIATGGDTGTGNFIKDSRIDHCDFGSTLGSNATNIIDIRPGTFLPGDSRRLLVDYCYFHDFSPTVITGHVINSFIVPGQANAIGIARGETYTVDHCLFQNIDCPGTGEFIMLKTGGVIVRFSTFINMSDHVHFRMTENTEFRSNWVDNMEPMRVFGANHLVIGNRFIGTETCSVCPGNGTKQEMIDGAPLSLYMPCRNSTFIGNRFGSGLIRIGQLEGSGWSTINPPIDLTATNLLLEANTRDSGAPAHEVINTFLSHSGIVLTVNATTTAPFVPAVQLTSSDVGLLAADPLCP